MVACVCAVLCAANAYAASPTVVADLDGDGHGDHVSFDANEPSVVRIWLSATGSVHIIRSAQPLRAITAVDLNGDHRSELIATTQSSGLHVWTKARRDGFRAYRRKHPPRRDFSQPERRHVDGNDGDTAIAISTAKPLPPSTATNAHRRGPPPLVRLPGSERTYAASSSVFLDHLSPRPPPPTPSSAHR
jgi:hypothetical protein